MGILKKLLPHFTIALAVALAVVVIVDVYNPMMGFLMGKPFQVLVFLEVICSLATALCFIFNTHHKEKKPTETSEKV